MSESIYKYCLKVFSLVLLISFLNTNSSLCGLLIDNCKSEKTSCCCKEFKNNSSSVVNLEKKCSCEINETIIQLAEINLSQNESTLKNLSLTSSILYSNKSFCNSDFDSGYTDMSFHLPPKRKIQALNSNFRI